MRPIALLCAFLLLPCTAPAQQRADESWDAIARLKPQVKVEVHSFNGKKIRGEFRSATADSVSLLSQSGELTLARADVREFKVRRTSGRFRNAGVGAAIGGGVVGGILAAILRGDLNDDGLALPVFIVFTATAAIVGFGIGVAFPGYNTIYRVK
jgi:hypothetical protein